MIKPCALVEGDGEIARRGKASSGPAPAKERVASSPATEDRKASSPATTTKAATEDRIASNWRDQAVCVCGPAIISGGLDAVGSFRPILSRVFFVWVGGIPIPSLEEFFLSVKKSFVLFWEYIFNNSEKVFFF